MMPIFFPFLVVIVINLKGGKETMWTASLQLFSTVELFHQPFSEVSKAEAV